MKNEPKPGQVYSLTGAGESIANGNTWEESDVTDNFKTENEARQETVCRGCGRKKSKGLIVCWNCFKRRTDITPLKHFNGNFTEWLQLT